LTNPEGKWQKLFLTDLKQYGGERVIRFKSKENSIPKSLKFECDQWRFDSGHRIRSEYFLFPTRTAFVLEAFIFNRAILKSWQHRKLTLMGKITIIKSLALSKLVHLLTALPNLARSRLNEVTSLFYPKSLKFECDQWRFDSGHRIRSEYFLFPTRTAFVLEAFIFNPEAL
jgi:hypothetical protein